MRKRRKHTIKKRRWLFVLLLLIIPLFYLGRRFYIYISAIQEEHRLRKQILILQAENEVLKNRLHKYKCGTLLEAKARDDLGMIKKGEKVYLVPRE